MEEQNSIKITRDLCSNCNSSLVDQAQFCHHCGQKNTDGRITVKEFFSQFFDNVFNLDSKIFRTLAAVLSPGKLTLAFLNGQRQKYYHPIRLFLVLILISIAGLNYQSDISSPTNLNKEQIDRLQERTRLMNVLDDGIISVAEKTDQAVVQETLDSLSNTFYRNSGRRVDSININDAISITNDFNFNVALEDFGKYTPEEILEIYKVEGFYKRLMVKQKIKMIEKGTSFIPFVMGKVTWSVFFVLLILTLIFKLLYARSNFLYLQHLIFGIHLNSFFFIIAFILTLLPEQMMTKVIPWALLVMATYFFIALKRVYKQSYLITSLKFILVVICYFFSFIFGIVLTMIGSFLLF